MSPSSVRTTNELLQLEVKNDCAKSLSTLAPRAGLPTCLFALALTLLGTLAAPALAQPADLRPGLRNSAGPDQLSARQLELLAQSLREKTGWPALRFDEEGFLVLGDRTRSVGGSATARALLAATVDGAPAILLRNRRGVADVAFARVLAGATYAHRPTGQRIDTYWLELDFADFAQVRGGSEALAAFEPGFVALHELAHAVLALADDLSSTRALGECEAYVNRIRRELRLPERQHYTARLRKATAGGGTAELLFLQREADKTRYFYLHWPDGAVPRGLKA
jgi:hypothetical protein